MIFFTGINNLISGIEKREQKDSFTYRNNICISEYIVNQWGKRWFNKMYWDKLVTHFEKMKLQPIPYTFNIIWIKDLNVKEKTLKLLEGNIKRICIMTSHS